MRKKLITCLLLLLPLAAALAQEKKNQLDAQQRKQGAWTEEVPEIRGEPGYTWEGNYRNGRKEGVWKKYTPAGSLIAEETFRNNVLDGYCRYYYPNGRLSAEGMFVAVEIEGQKDTIIVIDPVTLQETLTEVVRKGNSVRQGVWKTYDEDGRTTREFYDHGEPVAPEALDSTAAPAAKPAQRLLPHEKAAGTKKGRHP